MPPRVTVLHLDTRFPRLPGDIGCPDTFTVLPDIRRIPGATARGIVSHDPRVLDLTPFVTALRQATGDIVTTSCGFLEPHQAALEAETGLPVVASALSALSGLARRHGARNVAILTFDAAAAVPLVRASQVEPGALIGLPPGNHLREVIDTDAGALDPARAEAEILALLRADLPGHVRALLLECTNLPPYAPAIRRLFDGEVVSLLTCIEDRAPGAIRPGFL